jgi:hypothetical protein
MVMFRIVWVILLVCLSVSAMAGDKAKLRLQFHVNYQGKPLVPDSSYSLPGDHSIVFEAVRFYISNIRLMQGDKVVSTSGETLLVDITQPETMVALVPSAGAYDNISFDLGIDSLTNVSGAMGGTLDPANGMYWAWQSGYINMKLEGTSDLCPTRKNRFQFHLGGYDNADNALQHIVLDTPFTADTLHICLALDAFLASIDIAKQNEIMIPGAEAVQLSKHMAAAFHVGK